MSAEAPELTCQELVEIITDYLEGALPPRERARFEAHLRTCDGCHAYLEQMRTTIQIAGTLSAESVDPIAAAELQLAFRNWSKA